MVVKVAALYNKPHTLWQTTIEEYNQPESALGVSVDAGGIIVIQQEDREILLNPETLPALIQLLKKVTK